MLLACSSSSDNNDVVGGGSPDAMDNTADVDAAIPNGVPDASLELARIPDWTLEDIQTDSGMFGQTYGLDTFADKILVVVVVQGF